MTGTDGRRDLITVRTLLYDTPERDRQVDHHYDMNPLDRGMRPGEYIQAFKIQNRLCTRSSKVK
jgi:hypothetical protein